MTPAFQRAHPTRSARCPRGPWTVEDGAVPQGFDRWLLCYDTDDDDHRRGLVQHFSALGERVQFSVFVCWLGAAEQRQIGRQLRRWPTHQGREHCLRSYRLSGETAASTSPSPTGPPATGPAAYWLA